MKKVLDIENINVKKNEMNIGFCFPEDLATIFNYYGKEFAYPLFGCYNFGYKKITENGMKLGDRLYDKTDYTKTYEKFGIKLKKHPAPPYDDYIDFLIDKINRDTPLIVHFDCYYIPWDPNYKIQTNGHMLILKGYDKNTKEFIFNDPYFNRTNEKFSFASMEDASRFYYDISGFNDYPPNFEYVKLIKEHFNCISKDYISDLNDFLSDSENYFNVDTEFERSVNSGLFFANSLLVKIWGIIRSKLLLILSLEAINKKLNNPAIDSLMNISDTLKSMWISLYSYFAKSFYRHFGNNTEKGFVDRLKDIIVIEKQLFDCAISLDNSFKMKNDSLERIPGINYRKVDIVAFANNKGFKTDKKQKVKPDLTGAGEYILIDAVNKIDKNIFETKIFYNQYDNVVCRGQKIIFQNPQTYSCGIAALIISEWGDFNGIFTIGFSDKTTETVSTRFYDFRHKTSDNNFIGPVYSAKASGDKIKNKKAYINVCNFYFNRTGKIDYIILPICENLHLVALSVIDAYE